MDEELITDVFNELGITTESLCLLEVQAMK